MLHKQVSKSLLYKYNWKNFLLPKVYLLPSYQHTLKFCNRYEYEPPDISRFRIRSVIGRLECSGIDTATRGILSLSPFLDLGSV